MGVIGYLRRRFGWSNKRKEIGKERGPLIEVGAQEE